MAVGTPVQRYGAASLAGQTTESVISPATTVAAGTLAVLLVASGQSKTAASVTDSLGNTWTVHVAGTGGTGANALSIASAQIATQITSSDTVTVTWSGATSSAAELWIYEVSSAATSSAFDTSAIANTAVVAADSGNTATLAQADEVVFGISKITASGRTFTPEGSYSVSANPTRGATTSVAFKVVAATTAVSFTGTWSSTDAATVTAVATFKGLPASLRKQNLALMGVG